MLRKTLLLCGIASSLLYIAMNFIVAMQWQAYSSASQTVSELSAIGAPTRSLWVILGAFYTVLVTAFGWGVWRSAGENRALRSVGGLVLTYGALGLLWPLAPMHLRETLAAGGGTWTDTVHVALGTVTVLLMLTAMAIGAGTFGKWFGVYSIASLAVLFIFAALTFRDAPGISRNLPTPWIGVWERINIGVFLTWVVVLAIALWNGRDAMAQGGLPERRAFKTMEGEAAYLTAYDAAMKCWPVPFELRRKGAGPFRPTPGTEVVSSGVGPKRPQRSFSCYLNACSMLLPFKRSRHSPVPGPHCQRRHPAAESAGCWLRRRRLAGVRSGLFLVAAAAAAILAAARILLAASTYGWGDWFHMDLGL